MAQTIGLVIAVLLAGYLVVALLFPKGAVYPFRVIKIVRKTTMAGVTVTNHPCQVIGRHPYPIRFGPNQLANVSNIHSLYTSAASE